MKLFSSRCCAWAFSVAAVLALAGSPAYATLSLTLTDVGTGATMTLTDSSTPGVITFNGSFGSFSFESLTVTSNYNGSLFAGTQASGGQVQDVQLSTRNATAGTDTLRLSVSATPFSLPSESTLLLTNTLASSFNQGTATFGSTLTSGPNSVSTGTITSSNSGATSSSGPLIITPLGAFETTAVAQRTGDYTLSNIFTISLGSTQSAQLTGTTMALAPEPATVASALLGLPMIGLAAWLRRRKAKA